MPGDGNAGLKSSQVVSFNDWLCESVDAKAQHQNFLWASYATAKQLFNLSQSFPAVFMSTLKEGLPSLQKLGPKWSEPIPIEKKPHPFQHLEISWNNTCHVWQVWQVWTLKTIKNWPSFILVAGCPARVQAQANTFFCSSVAVLGAAKHSLANRNTFSHTARTCPNYSKGFESLWNFIDLNQKTNTFELCYFPLLPVVLRPGS